MPATVDYFMTPVSPFTYMGHRRFRQICRQHGAQINLRVMDLGKVFPVSGGLPLKDRPPQRRAYRMMELKRWREYLGVPLNLEPKFFRCRAKPLPRRSWRCSQRHGIDAALDVAGDCLRAIWAEDRDISARATLHEIVKARWTSTPTPCLPRQLRPKSRRCTSCIRRKRSPRGVFGSPTYVLNDEFFWGQDRLDFLDRALGARLVTRAPDDRRRLS